MDLLNSLNPQRDDFDEEEISTTFPWIKAFAGPIDSCHSDNDCAVTNNIEERDRTSRTSRRKGGRPGQHGPAQHGPAQTQATLVHGDGNTNLTQKQAQKQTQKLRLACLEKLEQEHLVHRALFPLPSVMLALEPGRTPKDIGDVDGAWSGTWPRR